MKSQGWLSLVSSAIRQTRISCALPITPFTCSLPSPSSFLPSPFPPLVLLVTTATAAFGFPFHPPPSSTRHHRFYFLFLTLYFQEFRCFVTDRKMNCICQYFDNCYFEKVVENQPKIQNQILEKWEQIKDLLPFKGMSSTFPPSQTYSVPRLCNTSWNLGSCIHGLWLVSSQVFTGIITPACSCNSPPEFSPDFHQGGAPRAGLLPGPTSQKTLFSFLVSQVFFKEVFSRPVLNFSFVLPPSTFHLSNVQALGAQNYWFLEFRCYRWFWIWYFWENLFNWM